MKHRIRIEPEHRGGGRYTFNYLCSCGAKEYGFRSRAAADNAGREHQRQEVGRG